ncbi:MAG: BlaI/MecI/CopY family transcriptional regulator [Clostridia bacterium]|nr:BlaI/MecI/CopY family transcriptional regulator [Clostridia bacterium]
MAKELTNSLSRRERQIMDIIYRRGAATAGEVLEELPDSPSYSTVRALLRILEEKGYLKHESEGTKYVYSPSISKKTAVKGALKNLMNTFFNDSIEQAVSALLEFKKSDITDSEVKRLQELINKAKREDGSNE